MPLAGSEIKQWMDKEFPHRLVITSLLADDQLTDDGASVDVRLGHEFIIGERSILSEIEPRDISEEADVGQYLRRVHVPLHGKFALHPRQFALAATLEYIRLPLGLTAQVIGRSRWARAGLIIEMASFVHPGYAGCLTLELQNLGDLPLCLSPGYPVAQLIFDECDWGRSTGKQDPGQLTCATRPEFTPLLSDLDRAAFSPPSASPDFPEALNNWASACIDLAHLSAGEERERQLAEAERLCTEAEAIKPGAGIYNLARAHALHGREDEAFAELREALATRAERWSLITTDPDWNDLRDHAEYKKLEAEFGGASGG